MRILIFNWRDIKNPEHGGAEVLTHEMAKRWVDWGHSVTQFSSYFARGSKYEIIDGINVVREGSSMIRSFHIPVHIAAFFWYRTRRDEFDIVIDEIHGIPFFSPLYVKQPVVALICEVAGDLWRVAFSFPGNVIGPAIEKMYFQFYQSTPFMTISPSSKDELVKMGVSQDRITILPMGVTIPKTTRVLPKEKSPTIIYVGRLTRAKGIEEAITATKYIKFNVTNIRLWIIGNGEASYINTLRNRVYELDLHKNIRFYGFTSESKKFELMSRAHLLIAPSHKEGWGLTVPEAGSVGTPAVGYNVAGLKDVIHHEQSGILTDSSRESLATAVIRILGDKKLYRKLAERARELTRSYSWEKTARKALNVLEKAGGL